MSKHTLLASGAAARGVISATLLTTEGADFQRRQGYAQKQGAGIFPLKPPEALEMVRCGNVTWAKGGVSEQGVLHSWLHRLVAARYPR